MPISIKDKLFPPANYTLSEMQDIAAAFNQPAVQKFLKSHAQETMFDIAHASRKDGESAESYLERLAVVSGGLAVYESLLAIETAPTAANS